MPFVTSFFFCETARRVRLFAAGRGITWKVLLWGLLFFESLLLRFAFLPRGFEFSFARELRSAALLLVVDGALLDGFAFGKLLGCCRKASIFVDESCAARFLSSTCALYALLVWLGFATDNARRFARAGIRIPQRLQVSAVTRSRASVRPGRSSPIETCHSVCWHRRTYVPRDYEIPYACFVESEQSGALSTCVRVL